MKINQIQKSPDVRYGMAGKHTYIGTFLYGGREWEK